MQACAVIFLSYLKGVFCDSRQAIVHGAPSTRVDYYLSYLICFTQLGRSVRLNDAHQSWRPIKTAFRKHEQEVPAFTNTVLSAHFCLHIKDSSI